MAKVFIEETTLTSIGDAIRGKTGNSELINPANMADEISSITTGGGDLPEEALTITGDCEYRFTNNGWNWFINTYGNQITTESITDGKGMFYSNSKLEKIPFDLNFSDNSVTGHNCENMFYNNTNVTEIGKIINLKPSSMCNIFYNCANLKEVPEFENLDMSYIYANQYKNNWGMFMSCCSLRTIPESLLNVLYSYCTSYSYSFFYNMFYNCFALGKIKGLMPISADGISSNMFTNTFDNCSCAWQLTFALQEDGTPYTTKWKNQTIDLTKYFGYAYKAENITGYNSGLTEETRITNGTNYLQLQYNSDAWTTDVLFSKYNRSRAIDTINSLPDTSAYLTEKGGTNTIKFNGSSCAGCSGMGINTLTEAEIAVATAKGWTVTLV